MDHLEHSDVSRYLDAVAARFEGRGREAQLGRAPFVTISRESGALGRRLADAVIERLKARGGPLAHGWETFDRHLLAMLAGDPKLKFPLRELVGEEYHSRVYDYIHQLFTWSTPQDIVQKRVLHALISVAATGRVVIVGRAGALVTRGLKRGVHIRLVASTRTRVENVARRDHVSEEEALWRVRDLERSRLAFARKYLGHDLADPRHYDAVFNVDRVDLQDVAEWIVERVAALEALAQAPSQRAASSA